jgi:hypothetical protein
MRTDLQEHATPGAQQSPGRLVEPDRPAEIAVSIAGVEDRGGEELAGHR